MFHRPPFETDLRVSARLLHTIEWQTQGRPERADESAAIHSSTRSSTRFQSSSRSNVFEGSRANSDRRRRPSSRCQAWTTAALSCNPSQILSTKRSWSGIGNWRICSRKSVISQILLDFATVGNLDARAANAPQIFVRKHSTFGGSDNVTVTWTGKGRACAATDHALIRGDLHSRHAWRRRSRE